MSVAFPRLWRAIRKGVCLLFPFRLFCHALSLVFLDPRGQRSRELTVRFQVIDRRVREKNVYSELLPLTTTAKELGKKKNLR